MSIRVFVSADDEAVVARIMADLNRRELSGVHKWHALRLALAISFRLPFEVDLPRFDPPGGGSRAEYRLDQLTGLGKRDDLTMAIRAMLNVMHQKDLFDPNSGDDWYESLLQYHLHRGLQEIQRGWRNDEPLAVFLLRALGGTEAGRVRMEEPRPPDRLKGALEEIGVIAEVLPGSTHGPRLTRYLVSPRPQDLARLKSGMDTLSYALGYPPGAVQMEVREDRVVALYLPRQPDEWIRYSLGDLSKWAPTAPQGFSLPLCPGVDILGRPVWLDLVDETHILIAGVTGSGKSVCLHALLCSLLLTVPLRDVSFLLLDPKQVELGSYGVLPNLRAGSSEGGRGRVLTEAGEMAQALQALCEEMDRRYEQLRGTDSQNLKDARARGVELPWIVVAVEELADLVLRAPQAQDSLVRLAQKGRAAGIHLILATQRPDAETLRGLLRSNIPTRIALAVQKSTESRIILDEEGAERLLKPGDMLIKRAGQHPTRVHGLFLTSSDVGQVARRARERNV